MLSPCLGLLLLDFGCLGLHRVHLVRHEAVCQLHRRTDLVNFPIRVAKATFNKNKYKNVLDENDKYPV